ncbi:MAG TPA: M3 family metallopeptidase, partial [Gammaproteobacteria bacterium]|nr:M3 family metallopeptidase [Gammaproteobacteria bacterium]
MYRIVTLIIAAGAAAAIGAQARAAAPQSASAAASATPAAAAGTANPLLRPSPLPFQAPPFDKIKDGDFQPAIEEGMRQQLAEVEAIANNPAAPTFQNTIVAMEKTGDLLNRAEMVFGLLTSANTDPTLQQVQQTEAPKLAAHNDAIFLNPKLWARVKTIYGQRDKLKLDPESARLLWYYHEQFVHAGANLSEADKAKLKKLNEEAASLSSTFVNKLLAATKDGALVVSDKSELAGLSDGEIEAAAEAAKARGLKDKWVIPLQNTTQQPALNELTNRATRHELFENSWTRAEKGNADDTRATIAKLAKVRAEKAKLLGYPDFAAWKLTDQMAKTPQTVDNFLSELVGPSTATARQEAEALQKLIDASGNTFTLEPWDWEYYAEKLRAKKYDFNEDSVKPY